MEINSASIFTGFIDVSAISALPTVEKSTLQTSTAMTAPIVVTTQYESIPIAPMRIFGTKSTPAIIRTHVNAQITIAAIIKIRLRKIDSISPIRYFVRHLSVASFFLRSEAAFFALMSRTGQLYTTRLLLSTYVDFFRIKKVYYLYNGGIRCPHLFLTEKPSVTL